MALTARSTAHADIEGPPRVIDLEMETKVLKDHEGRKSVMVQAHQSGMSHATITVTLKKEEKSDGSCESLCFIEGNVTNQNLTRSHVRHGEASKDLD